MLLLPVAVVVLGGVQLGRTTLYPTFTREMRDYNIADQGMVFGLGKRSDMIRYVRNSLPPSLEDAGMLMAMGKRSFKGPSPSLEDSGMLMGMGKRSFKGPSPSLEDSGMLMGMGKRSFKGPSPSLEDSGMLMGMGKRSFKGPSPSLEDSGMLMGRSLWGKRSFKGPSPSLEDSGMLMGMGKRSNEDTGKGYWGLGLGKWGMRKRFHEGPSSYLEDTGRRYWLMGKRQYRAQHPNIEGTGILMGMRKGNNVGLDSSLEDAETEEHALQQTSPIPEDAEMPMEIRKDFQGKLGSWKAGVPWGTSYITWPRFQNYLKQRARAVV